jgi:hypothetical protein
MKIYLECWWFGKRTICLELNNISENIMINDLLVNLYKKNNYSLLL